MAKFLAIVLAVLAVQAVFAAPKKANQQNQNQHNQPQQPELKTQLEQLAHTAQETVHDVVTKIQNVLPDSRQATEFLGNQAHTISENFQTIVDKINTELKNNKGQIDDALKQASDVIAERVTALKNLVGADITGKAEEIKRSVDDTLSKTASELDNLVKQITPDVQQIGENIQNFAKGLLDNFVATTRDFQQQLDDKLHQQAQQQGRRH